MIYLDNSATTQVDERVLDAMLPWLRDGFGNASSIYRLGRQARLAIENAREEIASLIGAHPAEILFTSGGTESNNTILKSCLQESALAEHLFVGASEHHAVLHPSEHLKTLGIDVQILPTDDSCRVLLGSGKIPSKALYSVMHGNNEVGSINDLAAIRERIGDALLHTDAVQTFGKIPTNMRALGVDFATVSAHKIHGPKGIGACYIRKGIDFKAHQQGGGQERNRRAGTEPVALVVGFQVAARQAIAEMEAREAHCRSLCQQLRQRLECISGIVFNTPQDSVLPTIVSVTFADADRLDGEGILQNLDIRGIAVSNGSACVAGTTQASHVLLAMGRTKAQAKCAVRFSVSKDNTPDQIDTAVDALADVIEYMRG